MSQHRTPLSHLLSAPAHGNLDDPIVAFGASRRDPDQDSPDVVHRSQFIHDVTTLATTLQDHPSQRWALFQPDAYHFAVGFFGLLHAHKTAILPPNAQDGTLQGLAEHVDGFLVDGLALGEGSLALPSPLGPLSHSMGEGEQHPAGVLQPLDLSAAHFELFTSGSTGRARCIPKRLLQLDAELDSLHQKWGETFCQSAVVSTVSQQHIYGLLFRICWPLSAGTPFCRQNLLFPPSLVDMLHSLPEERRAVLVSTPSHLRRCASWLDLTPLAPRVAMSVSSGGPLPADVAHQIEHGLGAPPFEVLGSSETGGVAWRQQHIDASSLAAQDATATQDSRWRPLPQVEIRRDEQGALCVRSPFAPGGGTDWFAMGDQIDMADDGSFRLLGRSDRIVKIAEKRLSLQAMEERLLQHPFVEDCAVLLLPHQQESDANDVGQATPADAAEGREQRLGALVTLSQEGRSHRDAESRQATMTSLRKGLSQHFERVLLPKRWRFVDAIPQDPQGKRQRHALEAMFQDEVDNQQPAQSERGDIDDASNETPR